MRTVHCIFLAVLSFITVDFAAGKQNNTQPSDETIGTQQKNTFDNDAQIISGIQYIGCQRIDKETVESYLPLQVGSKYDGYIVNKSLKALYATGFYEDVKITMEDNILIVNVKEYPIIEKISFEGNSKISDKELNEVIKLKSREILSPAKVREIQQGLLETYRKMGRYNASVEPKIIKLENNRVNLVFEIREGTSAGIENIVFVGNDHFSASELRDVISSKIKRWYRFFVNDDIYDNDRMNADKALLYRHYREHGFANVNILSSVAELSADKKGFVLTFTIDEGDIYKIDKIEIQSHIKKLDVKDLNSDFYCKKGDIYNVVLIDADLAGLIKKINNKGLVAVKIFPEMKKNHKNKTVSLVYHVTETKKIYISKVVIKGNHRTRDHVIRREIPLHEGDAINDTLLTSAENNIRGLGFFKSVNIETFPDTNSPDKCIVQVTVEEQSTGEVVASGSYSTSDGFGLDLSYNERNFYGTGKSFGVSLGSGRTRCGKSYEVRSDGSEKCVSRKSKFKFFNSIAISAADPHLFNKDIEGSLTAYRYTSSRFNGFTTKELGTTIGISYDLNPKTQQRFDYTFINRKFDDVDRSASPIIKYQTLHRSKDGTLSEAKPGKSNLSSIKHNINYTTSFLTGLKGSFRTGLNTTVAGLGGDAKHLKNELYGAYVMTLWKKATLKFAGSYGVLNKMGKRAPLIIDSFTLGLDSFRGFDDCGLGPIAETTRIVQTKDALGNNTKDYRIHRGYIGASKYWKGTVELKFPIGLPEELQFRGFVFTDFGTAWGAPEKGRKFLKSETKNGRNLVYSSLDKRNNKEYFKQYGTVVNHKILDNKKIRSSIGFGVSFITPFGPMVFTYALPVRKEKYDEQQRFLVGFSTTF